MNSHDTPQPAGHDSRPNDQQERAADAALNPNDPAVSASSPTYAEFGGVKSGAPQAASHAAPASPAPGRDGSNDNPDEFSEFRDKEKDAQNAPATPADQPGHVEQNQAPDAVRATQNEDNDEQRTAWAEDDPRYAGGGTHNTRDEPAGNETTAK